MYYDDFSNFNDFSDYNKYDDDEFNIYVENDRINKLEWDIDLLKQENIDLKKKNKHLESLYRKQHHPAYRDDISVEDIVNMLLAGDSFNKISNCIKCDRKTIKNHLYNAYYTDEDIKQLRAGNNVKPSNWN